MERSGELLVPSITDPIVRSINNTRRRSLHHRWNSVI